MNLKWPVKGINTHWSFQHQAGQTCADAQNVRTYDPTSGRARGAQRPGLSRYVNAQPNSTENVKDINSIVTAGAYSAETTLGTRSIKVVTVVGRNVYTTTGSSYSSPTGNTNVFAATSPVVFSSRFLDDLYFVDGSTYVYYDSSADEVKTWTLSAGTGLPDSTSKARLIATYRNRIWLAGLVGDPQNWFASRVDAADDFDYAPTPIDAQMPVAGNQGDNSKLADKITCLVEGGPEDSMIIGCDSSIHKMSGDPAAGGRLDEVSDVTGMAWGRPYCYGPDDTLYFVGSRGGFYVMPPNGRPDRVSKYIIEEDLADIDYSDHLVRLAWDDRHMGVHIFITDLGGGASTHWYYDVRHGAFWKDKFTTAAHNPISVFTFDGDAATDRVVLLGGQDGYIRKTDTTATNDDTDAIDSYIKFGPFQSNGAETVLNSMSGVLASGSADCYWELYRGDNAEDAFNKTVVHTAGVFTAGRNRTHRPRVRGDSMYLKVGNNTVSEKWSWETADLQFRSVGGPATRSV